MTGISEKSRNLDMEVSSIDKVAADVYQVMQEVNNLAQEMAVSSTEQAQSTNEASENVSVMGEMIGENGAEIMKLNEASVHMRTVSEQAVEQFVQLNQIIEHVREAIHFLSQQTKLLFYHFICNAEEERIQYAAAYVTGKRFLAEFIDYQKEGGYRKMYGAEIS